MKPVVDFLSSYALACVLLAVMFVLTIFGTLYQVDNGLYEAKQVFFNSWFLWTGGYSELEAVGVPYFPGGLTAMALLALNMFLGGFVRMRITQRNFGVVIIHLGVAFMLLAGMVKIATADEGKLRLFEGERANYFDSYYLWEVAIWDLDAGPGGEELVIPDAALTDLDGERKRVFTSPDLPFELELTGFMRNAMAAPKGPMWEASSPVVDGFALMDRGGDSRDENYVAGVTARVRMAGEVQENILWGATFAPWTVHADGKRYAIDLRNERYAMPFTIHLEDFQKEDHPGTRMAKAFRSWVHKIEGGDTERVLIQMNEPLRSDNLVLFQSQWGEFRGRLYSVFSVVHNVSDKWPEWSLWVITFGMLWTFGLRLWKFVKRQAELRQGQASETVGDLDQ